VPFHARNVEATTGVEPVNSGFADVRNPHEVAHMVRMSTPDNAWSADQTAVSDPRFWSHVTFGEGCWEYQGRRDRQGYGRLCRKITGAFRAHRYAWTLVNGPIPEGAVIRHSCDNPPCVRPDHLLIGTQADNIADRQARGRHNPGRLFGEAHPMHKLTAAQITEMVAMRKRRIPARIIAKEYGVIPDTVYRVTNPHLREKAA
jgi:hypothetical protein